MRARLVKLGTSLAVLAALAVGGSALASAAQKRSTAPPRSTQLQAGQQPSPETAAEPDESAGEATGGPVDTDNIQQGDQSRSDTAATPDAQPEASSSDGPGGYADSNPTADIQQPGEH